MTKSKNGTLIFYVTILEFIKKFSHEIYLIALPSIALTLQVSKSQISNLSSYFLIGVFIVTTQALSKNNGFIKALVLKF